MPGTNRLLFRSLVIGGNCNGCGGFGFGRGGSSADATIEAAKNCRKNIFFVPTSETGTLTRDLSGKHNSCKVHIRAGRVGDGLSGNQLMTDILALCGVADGVCWSIGNRTPINVIRATFKALVQAESVEEIAIKRGKRLINFQRAQRLEI